MILGLIARGVVWGIEAIQLAAEGVSAAKRLANAARKGKLPTPSADATEPFPLTYKDARNINEAAPPRAGHEKK